MKILLSYLYMRYAEVYITLNNRTGLIPDKHNNNDADVILSDEERVVTSDSIFLDVCKS